MTVAFTACFCASQAELQERLDEERAARSGDADLMAAAAADANDMVLPLHADAA